MGGRGRRNGNGEEGGATREEEKNTGDRVREGRMKKNMWRTHHRRVILQPGGDAYVSPPGPFETGGDILSPPVRNKPAVIGRWR